MKTEGWSRTYAHGEATVRCEDIGGRGLMSVYCTGAASRESFGVLHGLVLADAEDATCLLVDVRRLVLTDGFQPGAMEFGDSPAPAAFVVADERQLHAWRSYRREAGRKGLIRAVFLCRQYDLALGWAMQHSCL